MIRNIVHALTRLEAPHSSGAVRGTALTVSPAPAPNHAPALVGLSRKVNTSAGAPVPGSTVPSASIDPGLGNLETVTPMKLSEAMRLGCLLAPRQAHGLLVERDWFDQPISACALGAAALAMGIPTGGHEEVEHLYNLLGFRAPCPETSAGPCTQTQEAGIVAHLNDQHWWSRELIAEWLGGQGR